MKKFLAIFLTALIFFSMATMCISATSSPTTKDYPGHIDYLDFSAANNKWAETDKDGNLILKEYGENDYINGLFPTALLYNSSYDDNLQYSFEENGEIAKLTATNADPAGIAFRIDNMFTNYYTGAEANQHIEWVKMRIKNNSASSKFSIGTARLFGGNTSFDSRTVATVDIEPNMDGWTTYTFSARDLNFTQTGGYSWQGGIRDIYLFPFGYNKSNEGYEGAEIEIDYIVFGSRSYVDNYQSALEIKENSAETINVTSNPEVVTYYTGDKLNFKGFSAEITFSDGSKETITSASAVYDFEKPEKYGDDVNKWETPVQLKYGKLTFEYTVTVVDVKSLEFATEQKSDVYDRIDILRNGFTPVGLSLKVNFADGTSQVKNLHQFNLEGTDFTADAPLTDEGYYTYIITANYYGNTIPFLVNVIDIKSIELTPIEDKKNSIYYNTEITKDFFDVTCVYTDGSTKTLDKSGLENNFSVECNTATQGGNASALAKIVNTAYGINVSKNIDVTVQTPTEIEVKIARNKEKLDVDGSIKLDDFTISYLYADGKKITVSNTDPALSINYDTSVPSEEKTGIVKIGDMSKSFNYSVKAPDADDVAKAEAVRNELANRGTVKLLAPKFPTFWLVTIIVVAVVAVLVAAFCVLKFVFKVEFKFKKFDLDEIF